MTHEFVEGRKGTCIELVNHQLCGRDTTDPIHTKAKPAQPAGTQAKWWTCATCGEQYAVGVECDLCKPEPSQLSAREWLMKQTYLSFGLLRHSDELLAALEAYHQSASAALQAERDELQRRLRAKEGK